MNEQVTHETEPRVLNVQAGTLYLDESSMTHVILDPVVGSARKSSKQLRVTRWMLDNVTGEYYWLYSDQCLVNPRRIGEIISTVSGIELRASGRRGANLTGIEFSALIEQELTEALHKGEVTYEVR